MNFRQDPKDKTLVYIEGIIQLPISIIHNAKRPEHARKPRPQKRPVNHIYGEPLSRIGRVCVGSAKFKQTNHTVWSSDQPTGKYLAFDVEWPETPKDANYFDGFSILVQVTDDLHEGDLVLASTEQGFRLLTRERGGRFTDANDRSSVRRSSFVPIGAVYQTSGWLTEYQRSEGRVAHS